MRPWHRIAFLGATALAFALAIGFGAPASPVERAATALLGERWHQVELGGRPVGEFVTRSTRTGGVYRFETELAFRVDASAPTHIDSALVFDATAPHPLLRANHIVHNDAGVTAVEIRRLRHPLPNHADAEPWHGAAEAKNGEGHADGTSHTAARLQANVAGSAIDLDWDYALADYVALEVWLAQPRLPGERHATRSVDFDRLRLNRDVWQVSAARQDGYSLRRRTPFGAAQAELLADFSFSRFDIADWFSLRRVAGEEAIIPWQAAPAFAAGPLRIPIDKPLNADAGLERLVLRVHGDRDLTNAAWPALSRDADGHFTLARGGEAPQAVPQTSAGAFVAATVAHPAGNAEVQQLAAEAIHDAAAPSAQAEALTRFVGGFITYAEGSSAQSVAQTLKTRRGDCTAYADLLTTLARAIGLPARTVTGLAYAGGAFAVHNWTEIGIGGFWRGFDPTWGRMRLDAAHIPLPHDGELAALETLEGLRFELVTAEYRDGAA